MAAEGSGGGFTAVAVSNPLFSNASKSAAFSVLKSEEGDNELFNANAKTSVDPASLDVDEKELSRIRYWARMLRISMLVICTLMIITGFYNFLSTTSSSLSTSFLAAYLMLFASLLCCYECGLRMVATYLVQNFGFLYNPIGRFCFLLFVGFICFDMSTMGIVCFCLLVVYGCVNSYVHFKHPQYGRYLKATHAYNRATAKRGPVQVV
jgi:hypothetical protein